jgi:HEAT repeat protein
MDGADWGEKKELDTFTVDSSWLAPGGWTELLPKLLKSDLEERHAHTAALKERVHADKTVLPALQALLQDEDPERRKEAAFAFGCLGSEMGEMYVFSVAELLSDKEPSVRAVCMQSILKLGKAGRKYAEGIMPLLKDKAAEVRRVAAHTLGCMCELDRTIGNLHERGMTGVASDIGAMLEDPDSSVRRSAAHALARFGVRGAKYADAILHQLEKDAASRSKMLTALGKMPITERIAKKVAAYLNDPDHEVRNAGCQALSNMGPLCTDEYVDAINRLREVDPQVRDAAERALRTLAKQDGKRQHGEGELRSYIATLLKDPSVAQDPRWQAEKAKREAREKDKGVGKGKGHWGKGEEVAWKGKGKGDWWKDMWEMGKDNHSHPQDHQPSTSKENLTAAEANGADSLLWGADGPWAWNGGFQKEQLWWSSFAGGKGKDPWWSAPPPGMWGFGDAQPSFGKMPQSMSSYAEQDLTPSHLPTTALPNFFPVDNPSDKDVWAPRDDPAVLTQRFATSGLEDASVLTQRFAGPRITTERAPPPPPSAISFSGQQFSNFNSPNLSPNLGPTGPPPPTGGLNKSLPPAPAPPNGPPPSTQARDTLGFSLPFTASAFTGLPSATSFSPPSLPPPEPNSAFMANAQTRAPPGRPPPPVPPPSAPPAGKVI